jgi:hypothetical protein
MEDTISATVQTWIAKNELAELVAVLASAADRADRERIVSCYAEESKDDHGIFKGSGREFADFMCQLGSSRRIHHLLGQSVFDIHGDEAWGETFFVFHSCAGTDVVSGHGRYIDYFQRIDRAWKLKYRRVVPDLTPAGDDPANYWQPSRDQTDPAYDRRRSSDDVTAGVAAPVMSSTEGAQAEAHD